MHFFLQMLRFGVVGLFAAGIHFSIVLCLVECLRVTPLVANIAAFLVAFQISYWGHRLWTFQESVAMHRSAMPKLLLLQITNLAINEFLFYLLLLWHIPYPFALVIVLTLTPLFTFPTSRLWVFR